MRQEFNVLWNSSPSSINDDLEGLTKEVLKLNGKRIRGEQESVLKLCRLSISSGKSVVMAEFYFTSLRSKNQLKLSSGNLVRSHMVKDRSLEANSDLTSR